MSDLMRECIAKISGEYLSKSDEEFKRAMIEYESPLSLLNAFYQYCVADKELVKIEDLPNNRKTVFWKTANEWRPGQPKEKLIKLSKAIYLRSAV